MVTVVACFSFFPLYYSCAQIEQRVSCAASIRCYCNGWYRHGAHGCCYGDWKHLDMGMVCIAPKLHLSQLNCLRSNYCNKVTVLFCCNYSVPLPCCPRDLPMSAVSRGEGGQLGHADSNDRQVPVMITPDRFANKSVLMAACGGLHTVRCHEWACEFCTRSFEPQPCA